MKSKLKKKSKSEVELEIEIEAEIFASFFKKAVFNLAKNLKIPGFRQDKAPFDLLLKKLDKNQVLYEAANLAIEKSFLEAIKEHDLEIISQPRVEILKLAPDNPLIFKASFTVMPEIVLPDYKKIASLEEHRPAVIREDKVQEALVWLQKSRPDFKVLERPAQPGDFVEIEFSSPEINNNEPQEDAFILGKGQLLPEFENRLEGMKAGEEKEFSLFFKEDYFKKDLAGKKTNFNLKMKTVKEVILPEINDDFAKGLGDFQGLEALKENLKKGLAEEEKIAERQRVREEILKKISEKLKIEIPPVLVESEKQRMLADLKQRVSKEADFNFEEYLKKINKTESEILASFQAQAEAGIKKFLILKEIAKQEKIETNDSEIEAETEKFLKMYANPGQVEAEIDPQKLKSYTEEAIINEKVFQFLEKQAKNFQLLNNS